MSCALRLVRDVAGVDSGMVGLPCPLCRKYSFLETNTVFLHPCKRGIVRQAVWRDNKITSRVLFEDTGVADTRTPIVLRADGRDIETSPMHDDDMECTRASGDVLMRLRRLMLVQDAMEKAEAS
jgi:hypothetical protein